MPEPSTPTGPGPRVRAALLAALCVPLGLATKRSDIDWVAGHLGGAVYVVFFCCVWLAARPSARPAVVATVVTLATCGVELLQLSDAAWLEALRGTRAGGLLLGSTFSWGDLPYYGLGGVLAWVLARAALRR